jgi:hypothetical protein
MIATACDGYSQIVQGACMVRAEYEPARYRASASGVRPAPNSSAASRTSRSNSVLPREGAGARHQRRGGRGHQRPRRPCNNFCTARVSMRHGRRCGDPLCDLRMPAPWWGANEKMVKNRKERAIRRPRIYLRRRFSGHRDGTRSFVDKYTKILTLDIWFVIRISGVELVKRGSSQQEGSANECHWSQIPST